MNLIICVDDHMGMSFNRRRQSQDSVLRQRILSMTQNSHLWMTAYTYGQFKESPEQIVVRDDILKDIPTDAYCFLETVDPTEYLENAQKLILYRWNRSYPADLRLECKLSDWTLVQREDFKGSSHDSITEEVYIR